MAMRLRTLIAVIMTISMCRVILQCSNLCFGHCTSQAQRTFLILRLWLIFNGKCSRDPWVSETGLKQQTLNIFHHSWQEFSPHWRLITVKTRRWTRTTNMSPQTIYIDSPHINHCRTNPMFLNLLHTIMFMSRKASKIENKDLSISKDEY